MKREQLSKFVGAKIHDFRKEMGLRQGELGALLDVSRVSILNLESGRHRLTIDHLFFLCGLFKKKPDDFFPPIDAVSIRVDLKDVRVTKKVRQIKVIKTK